jgi:hypothetical protein
MNNIYIYTIIYISIKNFTSHSILFGDQIEKNEMGRAYRPYGGEERRIQGFGGET